LGGAWRLTEGRATEKLKFTFQPLTQVRNEPRIMYSRVAVLYSYSSKRSAGEVRSAKSVADVVTIILCWPDHVEAGADKKISRRYLRRGSPRTAQQPHHRDTATSTTMVHAMDRVRFPLEFRRT